MDVVHAPNRRTPGGWLTAFWPSTKRLPVCQRWCVDDLVAAGYDAVYANWARSRTFHAIWQAHAAGEQEPPGFENLNFLTRGELERLAAELHLRSGERAAELACGAGGLSVWLAQQAGVGVVGIDLSRVGARVAAERAVAHSVQGAVFVVGAVGATPFPDASLAGVVSVDSLQYVPDKRAAMRDVARILASSRRFAFTAFELEPVRVAGLPVLGVDPVVDYSPLLVEAGFRVDAYEEMPGWRERVHAAFSAVVDAADVLEDEMGREAVESLLLEVSLTLEAMPYRRRILAVATKGVDSHDRDAARPRTTA
jgi:SAM-dependent methyltransferase